LDFLGFPWILSSEMSLFNGLRGIFAENIFSALSTVENPGRGQRLGDAEAQDCSWTELNLVSDFLQ
jgi:hypothetical protein